MSQFKGKKMTFDEYEHKLSSKPNNSTTNKNSKRPVVQSAKPIQKTKIITTVKQQYSQKPFKTTNGRSPNISHTNESQITQGNQSNITIINQSSFTTNPLDSYSQHSSSYPYTANNHYKAHEVTRETIPPPIFHTSPAHKQAPKNQPQPMSNKSQEVNKIDLIFEKEPQDVQKKLRMLLLNYNAVMQYNQDQDKFEVDLLLPFNTPQEKQLFVQKFMKTRHYLSQQIQQDQLNHQMTNQPQNPKNHHFSHNPSHQYNSKNLSNNYQVKHQENRIPNQFNTLTGRSNQNHSNSNPNSNHSQDQHAYIPTKKSPNQSYHQSDNVLSTSLREEAQKIHQEKQLKETDHKIDFFALSQSLDLSIQRGLTLIRHEKIIKQQKESQTHKIAQSNESKQAGKQHSKNDTLKQSSQDENPHIQRTESHSRIQQESHVNQFREPASEIESEISQGLKANIPHSMQTNLLHTPSGKKNPHESAQMKPLQPNESEGRLVNSSLDYSQQEYSRMIKPTGNSLYESPIVPLKNPDSYDRNNNSNEILIQDLENYDDIEGYQTPDKIDKGKQDFLMDQESYNSAFDMIEETAQENQDQHFPSSLEYKEFLKKKIYDTNIALGSKEKNQPRNPSYSLSKDHLTTGYPRETTSSLRAKYSQFLSKNHKKIQSLYLRIGRQMRKKKQQQQNQQDRNSSQKRKNQTSKQILVADDDIEKMNEKEQNLLEGYKKRIVLENDSMSSEDKVRYFRYLAKHAKGLYIDFIRNQNTSKRNLN